MDTDEFRTGMGRLQSLADVHRVAIMCSEALWWRCHRGLIADFLKADGVEVKHILSATKTDSHPYTSAAKLVDGRLSYAATDQQARLL
jgi:uncharacterized protein (DUF488 family)